MVHSIMCCCGSGLGSSMLVRMNVEKALKKLGASGISVSHSSLSDVSAYPEWAQRVSAGVPRRTQLREINVAAGPVFL